MFYQKILLTILLLSINLCAVGAIQAGENIPAWLSNAAAQKNPAYDKDVPAVVLHNEEITDLGSDGQIVRTEKYAVRLLNRDGKSVAYAIGEYIQSATKVREIKAWLIRPNGTVKNYGKESVLDMISSPNDVYDEYRRKIIDAEDDADANSVFGYQIITEEKPLYMQDSFNFQNRLPTLFSRYTLNLPSNWQASSVTFNRSEIKPQVSGQTYHWEMRDLAPIPPEFDSPQAHTLAARVVVNFFPANGTGQNFKTWQEVSQWYTDLSQPTLVIDDAIAAKARELTATAKTELDKIKAVGNYVQNLQYISLQTGIVNYGGQRPRPSSLVMQRGYGDCKDKANLMRAMLKTLKIESYLVLIHSGDPTYVRAEWASPNQFNHCIIAVKVSDETVAPTVITDEKLGRLLIFDATDDNTLVGDLPDHEQGSFALIAAASSGNIHKMPVLPPAASRLERHAEATLLPDGSLQGSIREQAFGQAAARYRGMSRALSATDYKTAMESWLTYRVSGAKLNKITPTDRRGEGRFDLDLEFAANNYAQLMQGRLMIFKPAFVGRLDSLNVSEGKRIHPVLLDASEYSETIKVKLPVDFIVDEMPDASKMETPFGKLTVNYEVKDGFLYFSRTLTLNKAIIEADKYDGVKKFFASVRAAESSPVVLIKK